ncbi:MarR family transcriptional regulator [Cupriavidus cauae]|jgi:Transcriptional regulators|uniref:MarR family winged helix-turn-helix transcriptional regulator n=1 Tax=Cupriavidus TaxID=106589 RepID=UPI001CF39223|nr:MULTISPECIES: MarR family transcriptional regulator [Cupriavidus]MCA7082553.1 MarR family transcriptional regulator [Cupriavidus sp. DB3]UZN51421.1 MarR family transcriptional regulator [Cupriavidus cauae]
MPPIPPSRASHSIPVEPSPARLGRLIGAVYRRWRRAVDQSFRELGLTDASRAPLVALYESPAPSMRQGELADLLALDKSSLVRVLSQLREMGLVEWEADEADRRAKSIRLTASGRAMARRMLRKSLEIEAQILEALSPEELQTTRSALEKIARRLTEV